MMHVEAQTMSELYPKILEAVYTHGKDLVTRGKGVREVENMGFTLLDPSQPIVLQSVRKMNFAYAVVEALSMFMPGADVVDSLLFHNANMDNFRNKETGLFDGSYAERLTMYKQLRHCYDVLKQDPNTRRAVLDFYNAAHDQHESLDICCTLNMLFRIRDGKLNATVFMRGNDILWGTPYNFTMFTFIQNVMARWLGIPMGTYTHVVGSAHYYHDKAEEVFQVLAAPKELRKEHPLEKMPGWDIESVDDTFEAIAHLFRSEGLHRSGSPVFTFTKSHSLNYLWDSVILPHVQKKMLKLT